MAFEVGGVDAVLGARVDERGFREFDAAMAKAGKKEATATLKADVDERGFRTWSIQSQKAERETKTLTDRMRDLNIQTQFFGRTISLLKWPALITAAGLATQAIGALTAGVVGLTSALAPLSGLLVTYPAALGAFAQAAGTVTIAMKGLGEAIEGDKKAMRELAPEAKKFVVTLDELGVRFDRLTRGVQGGLFEGVTAGLTSAMKNFAPFRRVLEGTAEALGNVARRAGDILGRDGFGRDFERLGTLNTKLIERMGDAGLDLAQALRHVMMASRPLQRTLVQLSSTWAENAKDAAETGRRTGDLAKFFERTEKVLSRVLSIGGSVASTFFNIGKAARPLGDDILKTFDQIAAGMAKWTGSDKGQRSLTKFFEDAKKPLWEVGKLVRDLAEGFAELATGSGAADLIHQLRVELLPVLIETIEATTEAFGPVLIESLTQITKLLGSLAGTSGPLTSFTFIIGKLAEGINWLTEQSPFLKGVIVNLTGLVGVISTLGAMKGISEFFGFSKGLSTLKGIPGATKLLDKLKGGFDSVRLAAMYAGDTASQWIGGFTGKLRAGGAKVKDAIKLMLTKGRFAIQAAGSVVGEFVGTIVGRFGSSKLGQKLAPFFTAVAKRMGAIFAATTAAAVAVGEGIGGAAGSLMGKLKNSKFATVLKGTGRWAGRLFVAGFVLALPMLIPEITKVLKKAFGSTMLDDTDRESQAQMLGEAGFNVTGFQGKNKIVISNPNGGGSIVLGPKEVMPFITSGGDTGGSHIKGDVANQAPAGPRGPTGGGGRGKRGDGAAITEDDADETKKQGKRVRDEVKKTYEETHKKARDETKRQREEVTDNYKRQREQVVDTSRKQRADVGDQTKKTTDDVADRVKAQLAIVDESYTKQRDTAQERSGELRDAVTQSVNSARDAHASAMRAILAETNKALKTFGLDPVSYGASKPKGEGGKGGGKGKGGSAQRGGVLAGYSRTDDRQINVRGGEAILRPEDQIPFVDATMRAMHGYGLFDYMGATGSVMGFAKGGVAPGGGGLDYALGPETVPPIMYDPGHAGSNSHWHISGTSLDWVIRIGKQLQGMGFSVGEFSGPSSVGFGPVTVQHGDHGGGGLGGAGFPGHAIDVNSNADETHAETVRVAALLRGEGGGSAATNFVVDKIARAIITGPDGPWKDYAQAATDRVRRGASRFVGSKAPTGMTGAGGPMIPGKPIKSLPKALQKWNKQYPFDSTQTMPYSEIQKLAAWQGLPSWFWRITIGESSGQPGAVGYDPGGTMGYGLYQETTSFAEPYVRAVTGGTDFNKMLNPVLNTMAAKLHFDDAASQVPNTPGFPWYGTSGLAVGGVIGSVLNPNLSLNIGAANAAGDFMASMVGADYSGLYAAQGPARKADHIRAQIRALKARIRAVQLNQRERGNVPSASYTPGGGWAAIYAQTHAGRRRRAQGNAGSGSSSKRGASAYTPGAVVGPGGGGGRGRGVSKLAQLKAKLATLQSSLNFYTAYAASPAITGQTSAALASITGQLASGFGTLGTASQFGTVGGIEGALSRLSIPSTVTAPDWLTELSASKTAEIRRTLAFSTRRAGLFGAAPGSFAAGGVVGAGGGGAPIIVQPHVTVVAEGDLAAFNLRTKRIVVDHENSTARSAGLSRQTPSATGRRSKL